MSEADKQIKSEILKMVDMANRLNAGVESIKNNLSRIEQNLLTAKDLFEHGGNKLTQSDINTLLEITYELGIRKPFNAGGAQRVPMPSLALDRLFKL